MPNFVSYIEDDMTFKITPTIPSYHIGFFIVRGFLSDPYLSSPFSFSILVENDAPKFNGILRDQKLVIGDIGPEIYEF
jgi:hypothetical protein